MVNDPTISTTDVVVGTGSIEISGSLSQYVSIPPFDTGSDGLSFSFWFKFNSTNPYGNRIFDFGGASSNLYMGLGSDNDCLIGSMTESYMFPASCNLNVNDNLWRHFAWTLDALTNGWSLYVNGVFTKLDAAAEYPTPQSQSPNYLGRSNSALVPYLTGAIDEFYMFQYTLSASEIQRLYAKGSKSTLCGPILFCLLSDKLLSFSMLVTPHSRADIFLMPVCCFVQADRPEVPPPQVR